MWLLLALAGCGFRLGCPDPEFDDDYGEEGQAFRDEEDAAFFLLTRSDAR